ncbi:ATP-binding protein [Paenibacillus roseipurpureus]|uniref:ATP-binding protein n=1 Tax=Paenibacillus roseopurpureus TaxID=2918901 RepID=A0AA96LP00_9BACL|nr:ATP-binding protein [Paenibacillus sp. MBLB1832]WNR44021.1 ATP-binding protein [Paenibacillus sp. MBLB1832]
MESDSIILRNDLQELERLHAFFHGLAPSLGLTEKALFQINLVCDELVTNIILYGYPQEEVGLHAIHLDIGLVSGGWELRLTDRGKPFNPLLRATPQTDLSIEERGIGGLGIHLVKQVMDELHYERFNEENILMMRKNRTEEEVS